MAGLFFTRFYATIVVGLLAAQASWAAPQQPLTSAIKILPLSGPHTPNDASASSVPISKGTPSQVPTGITTNNRIHIPASLKAVELRIFALAGHRSFDTLRQGRSDIGWTIKSNNNALGIGTTATYGVKISEQTHIVPFLSVDYNRIDSARYINPHSAKPYQTDNADTGFAGSVGALVWHSLDSNGSIRIAGYAGLTMTAGTLAERREAGTFAGRVLQTLGDNGPLRVRSEFGLAANKRLAPNQSIRIGAIQAFDPVAGNSAAATLSYQLKF